MASTVPVSFGAVRSARTERHQKSRMRLIHGACGRAGRVVVQSGWALSDGLGGRMLWAWVHDALCRWIWPRAHSCGRVAGGGERRRVLELCARRCVRWGILAVCVVAIGGYRTGVVGMSGFLFRTVRVSGRAAEHGTLKTGKLPRGAGRVECFSTGFCLAESSAHSRTGGGSSAQSFTSASPLTTFNTNASGAHYHPF